MPPAPTGVVDYAAALLDGLRQHGRMVVAPTRCDVALYHLGNNHLHAGIYRRALENPGVVILHDAVLHHFLLGQLSENAYIEEFTYNYGAWSRRIAVDLWRGRRSSGADSRYFEYPMLRRIAERSLAVVVHNPGAAGLVERHAPPARIVEIPHLFFAGAGIDDGEVIRYRQDLGMAADSFVFGVFGYLRESKRVMTVLETFQAVRREVPRAALLIAGQFASTDLERTVAPLLGDPGVICLPHLADTDFRLATAAVDACINLRYPSAGETSGIVVRMMGSGKPVFVTDSPECLRFPEGACIRIPPGPGERESLRLHMILVSSMSDVVRAIGYRGASHIQTHHRVDAVSKQFWDLLCDFCT
jgi:glycosyltransferase involved in cell wall biosynthesis